MRGTRSTTRSWVFWCKFCEWQDVRTPAPGSTAVSHAPATAQAGPDWIHGVHLYDGDTELVSSVEEHLVAGWAAGGSGIVIATAPHRAALRERLATRGLSEAVGEGRLIELDAADTLSLFMRDGMPVREIFYETVGSMVRELAAEGPLHAFGEMVDVLWAQGNPAGALELEWVWSELQRSTAFALLCAYDGSHLDETGRAAIADVHDSVAAA